MSPLEFAWIQFALGDTDLGFRWLQKALEDRSFDLISIKVDPRFDTLKDDPRFETIARRMGVCVSQEPHMTASARPALALRRPASPPSRLSATRISSSSNPPRGSSRTIAAIRRKDFPAAARTPTTASPATPSRRRSADRRCT